MDNIIHINSKAGESKKTSADKAIDQLKNPWNSGIDFSSDTIPTSTFASLTKGLTGAIDTASVAASYIPTVGNITFDTGSANYNTTAADINIGGRSLLAFMTKVEERLCILQPDPAKLEKYAALREAYAHYVLMEKQISQD